MATVSYRHLPPPKLAFPNAYPASQPASQNGDAEDSLLSVPLSKNQPQKTGLSPPTCGSMKPQCERGCKSVSASEHVSVCVRTLWNIWKNKRGTRAPSRGDSSGINLFLQSIHQLLINSRVLAIFFELSCRGSWAWGPAPKTREICVRILWHASLLGRKARPPCCFREEAVLKCKKLSLMLIIPTRGNKPGLERRWGDGRGLGGVVGGRFRDPGWSLKILCFHGARPS